MQSGKYFGHKGIEGQRKGKKFQGHRCGLQRKRKRGVRIPSCPFDRESKGWRASGGGKVQKKLEEKKQGPFADHLS